MTVYAKHISTRQTHQSEPIPGKTMIENSAGGFGFEVSCWTRLDRFLVLGSEGPTYYATERTLTIENAACVRICIDTDAARTVKRIVEISEAGRAPKNDPAIMALAICASHGCQEGKQLALDAIPKVCRIPTHLFAFVETLKGLRGFGPAVRRAIGSWYAAQEPQSLAYQVCKYQSRNGWSHRDLLRLCHLKAKGLTNDIAHWAVKGWESIGDVPHPQAKLLPIWAFESAKRATDKAAVCRLIRDYNLPRECVPTQFLTEPSVWESLLERMPLTAMIRNLATMTRVGVLSPMSSGVGRVIAELANSDKLRKSRVHPVAVLAALLTYRKGHGERGKNSWTPVSQVIDALDGAFYGAFGNIESTGKRWLLALDVSGSMDSGTIAGVPGLSPRVGSAAMSLVIAASEPQHQFIAFTSNGSFGRASMHMGFPSAITPLSISPRQRLDDVCFQMRQLPVGGTDCALPMIYAMEQRIPIDVFVLVTDNETWAGNVHPCQALDQYRQRMGIGAKLAVIGMTATNFSIAKQDDAGMMDVVGFDTAVPELLSQFATS